MKQPRPIEEILGNQFGLVQQNNKTQPFRQGAPGQTNSQRLIGKVLPGTGRVVIPCARCHKRCNTYRGEGEYHKNGDYFFCYDCIEFCEGMGQDPTPVEAKYVQCKECLKQCKRQDGEYDPKCPDFFYCEECWEVYDPRRKIRGPKRHHKDVDEERDLMLDLRYEDLLRMQEGGGPPEDKKEDKRAGARMEADKKRIWWFITEFLKCQSKPVQTDEVQLVVDCDFRVFGFPTWEAFLRDVPKVSVVFNHGLRKATCVLTESGPAKGADAADAGDFKKSGPDTKTGKKKEESDKHDYYYESDSDSDHGFGPSFKAKPNPFMADDDEEKQYKEGPKDKWSSGKQRRKKKTRKRRKRRGPVPKDYYKELGVEHDAKDTAIRKAYRKKALKLHPDRHQKEKEKYEQLFKELTDMYGTLMDPAKRREYDDMLMDYHADDQGYAQGFADDYADEPDSDKATAASVEKQLSPRWWYSANGETVGPVPLSSMVNSYIAGSISDSTFVIDQKKIKNWTELRQVVDLYAYLNHKKDGRPMERPKRKENPDFAKPRSKMSKEERRAQKQKDAEKGKNLPPGWKQYRDKKGRQYYYHRSLNRTVWKMPKCKMDKKTGKPYVSDRWPPAPWRPMWNKKRERVFANHHTEKTMPRKDLEEYYANKGIYSPHDNDPEYDWEEYFDGPAKRTMWINRENNSISMAKPHETAGTCFRTIHNLDPDAY